MAAKPPRDCSPWSVKPMDMVMSGSQEDGNLTRCLGPFQLVMMGVGAIVGSGVFVLIGAAAAQSGPALCVSATLTGLLCMPTALCYAENSARVPVAGSSYVFVYTTLGELPAWMTAWNILLSYTLGISAVSRGLAGYINSATTALGGPLPLWLWHWEMAEPYAYITLCPLAVVLVGIVISICMFGIKESAGFNTVVASIKVVTLLVVIGAAASQSDVDNWNDFAPHGVPGVLHASAIFFFAYLGFDAVSACAEEAKDPSKDLPIGIVGSLLVAMFLYTGIGASITLMVPWDKLDKEAPLSVAFRDAGMDWTQAVVSMGAITGMTTSLTVGVISSSRLILALGRDGLLPPLLAVVRVTTGVPLWATIVTGIMASAFAMIADLEVLVDVVTIAILFAFVMVCSSVIVARSVPPASDAASGATNPTGRNLLGMSACFWAAAMLLMNDAVVGGFLSLAGFVVFAVLGLPFVRMLVQQPYSSVADGKFEAPLFPYLPLAGMGFNIFMMAQLPWVAWVQLAVWMTVGMLSYFIYCVSHSELRIELSERSALLGGGDAKKAADVSA